MIAFVTEVYLIVSLIFFYTVPMRSINSLYSRCHFLGEITLAHLTDVQCKPLLTYSLGVYHLNRGEINSLEYAYKCAIMKIF